MSRDEERLAGRSFAMAVYCTGKRHSRHQPGPSRIAAEIVYCFVAVNGAERPFCSRKPVILLSDPIVPEKFHRLVLPLLLAMRFHCQRTVCPATVPVTSPFAAAPTQEP